MVLSFESVDKFPKCNYSNTNYLAILNCGAVANVVEAGSNPTFDSSNVKTTEWFFFCVCGADFFSFFFFFFYFAVDVILQVLTVCMEF